MVKNLDLSVLDLPASPTELSQIKEVEEKLVCFLLSLGEPAEAVANKLRVSKEFVEQLSHSDRGVDMIVRFQSTVFPDPQIRIKRLANLAVDTQTRLMLKGSDNVKFKVAVDVLDRSGGKAVQRMENVNFDLDSMDPASLDKAIAAQQAKLDKLAVIEARIRKATPVEVEVNGHA
jgi:hypothetical protein